MVGSGVNNMEKKEMYFPITYGDTWLFIRLLVVVSIATLMITYLV
jgi:hypothetical protein